MARPRGVEAHARVRLEAMAGRSKAAERQQQRLREAEDRANEAFDLVAPLTEEIGQLTEKLKAIYTERDHLLELNQAAALSLIGSTEQCDKWAGMYAEVLRKSTRRLTELACEVSAGLLGVRGGNMIGWLAGCWSSKLLAFGRHAKEVDNT